MCELEETNLVNFLSRDDICVIGESKMYPGVTVYHKGWKFEGRGKNVIMAARAAMLSERKWRAENA